jgi:sugar-specific transcriptional regulator TrmB
LIELGETTVGPLIKKSEVASSKIYELLDKLMEKGLVTTFNENKNKKFKPISPERLYDYIEDKKKSLVEKQQKLKQIMPELKKKYESKQKEFEVEVFKGYKGVYNAFIEMISEMSKGEEYLVVGGGDKPSTNERTKLFFENIHQKRSKKGIILKILFSEARRKSYKEMSLFPHTIARYLSTGTPSTINIYNDTTVLLTMSPVPAAIRIRDKNITTSYRRYFNDMWKNSKK